MKCQIFCGAHWATRIEIALEMEEKPAMNQDLNQQTYIYLYIYFDAKKFIKKKNNISTFFHHISYLLIFLTATKLMTLHLIVPLRTCV